MNATQSLSRFPSPPLAPVEMHTSTIALMTRGAALQLQTRAAELTTSSFDPADNSIEVIFTTGATVRRRSWNDGPYDEELIVSENSVRLDRLNNGGPFLDTHDQFSLRAVIGSVVPGTARIAGGKGLARIKLSSAAGDADTVVKIKEGVIRNLSVGYITHVVEKQERDGQPPLWRVTDWEPYEISAVPAPADAGCQIRGAAAAEDDDAERNPPSPMTARQAMNLIDRAEFYGQRELAERMVRQGYDEQTIMQAVQESRRRAGDVAASIGGPRVNIHNERARVMSTGHNEISLDNPATRADAIVAAAVAAASGTEPKGSAREFSGLRSWDDFNRAYGGLIDRTAALGGVRAAHTTSDFPIVGAVGRVLVQRGYEASLSPWMALANQIDVPDFKGDTIARLSGTGKFLPVAETGEIKGTTRFEEGEAIRVGTSAQQIGLSRQLMINAGMRVAGDMFTALGKGGANALGEALSGLFLANSGNGATLSDGNATFTTTRGNKAASGAAIDVTPLGAARMSLRERKEADGITPIKLTPANIVCGPAGETPAEQALSTIWAGQVSDANPFTAKLKILIDQRIAGNAWYLFADPAEATMITVAYLNGQRTPIIEERQGWDVLATEYRGIFDFGVAITDWRPGYLNPGA